MVISPRLSVGSGSSSLGLSLDIDPLLGHGKLGGVVASIPVALGDSVGGIVSDVGVGKTVGGDLGSGGVRKGSVSSLDLGSRSVRNRRVGDGLSLAFFGVERSLVVLGEGLDRGV